MRYKYLRHITTYVYIYICINKVKTNRKTVSAMPQFQTTCCLKLDFKKVGLKYTSQVVSPPYQTQQEKSVATPRTPLYDIAGENTNLTPKV